MPRFTTLAGLAATALTGVSANAADRISDFSLIDHNGKFFQLSRAADNDAIVLLAHEDSREVRRAYGDLEKLMEQLSIGSINALFSPITVSM